MKKIFTFLTGTVVAVAGYAQLPQWVLRPDNDTLFVKVNDKLIQGQRNDSSYVCTLNGEVLYATDNIILPYKEGLATIQKKGEPILTGFIDENGKFTSLDNEEIAYDDPFFEDGYLLCNNSGNLQYFSKDGSKAVFYPVALKVYPFHRGYAPYVTFAQMDKRKDLHYGYYKANGDPANYIMPDGDKVKAVEPKDIAFLSAVAPDGRSVAVIKEKLYWYDTATESFAPILLGDDKSVKKRHLHLNGDYDNYFMHLPKDTVEINVKYGKEQFGTLKFDGHLRPVIFTFADGEMLFPEPPVADYVHQTDLSAITDTVRYGLSMDAKEALPPQFEQVGVMYGKKAFVKIDGKWGIVEIVPDLSYKLRLNKGEDIAFRHQKFETQLRLDLPASISAKDARIDIPQQTGCLIDKTSRECKDTESGNFVTYACELSIPQALPDTITDITYAPIHISYDGISLSSEPLSVKAWHLKSYNVDPIDSETSITDGVATFMLNVMAQKNVGEGDYPFEVRIEADSVVVESEKISETRYKYTVSNLREGDNFLNIYVTEKGCPSAVFPYELFYTKPEPTKKQAEEVVIRKRDIEHPKALPSTELINATDSIAAPAPAIVPDSVTTAPQAVVPDSVITNTQPVVPDSASATVPAIATDSVVIKNVVVEPEKIVAGTPAAMPDSIR